MKVETENSIENNEVKCLCFEKINKTDKTLYTLIKESREEAHYQYKKMKVGSLLMISLTLNG